MLNKNPFLFLIFNSTFSNFDNLLLHHLKKGKTLTPFFLTPNQNKRTKTISIFQTYTFLQQTQTQAKQNKMPAFIPDVPYHIQGVFIVTFAFIWVRAFMDDYLTELPVLGSKERHVIE